MKNKIIRTLKPGKIMTQTKNHVVAYDKPVGLLINFGGKSLQFKKTFHPKYSPNPTNPKIK